MSLPDFNRALMRDGAIRINAADFSQSELENAAASAREARARLIIYNLKGRTSEDIGRIAKAGGRQVNFGDIYLI